MYVTYVIWTILHSLCNIDLHMVNTRTQHIIKYRAIPMNIIGFWSSIICQGAWFFHQWIIITLLASSFFRLFCFWHFFLPEILTKLESISKYIYGFLIKQHRQGTPLCTDILGKEQLKNIPIWIFFGNFWSRFFMEWKLAIILALLFFKGSEKRILETLELS